MCAFFFALSVPALAQGSLTPPPGPPAPTMKTLDQIEPRKPINAINTPGSGGILCMKARFACLAGLLLTGVAIAGVEDVETQKQFFANLSKLCGQTFEGVTEFPQNSDHPMVGKKLVMSVASCSPSELRIPLQVGEDKSRTWVLTLSDKGLLLKHDHRHADGTPDQQTNYGGWATADGSANRQQFAADEETAKLIPEAATNVWTLEIDTTKQAFTYALERNKAPRYKAVFNLKALPTVTN